MYIPSIILETMTINDLCEHKGGLKFVIRHLYPYEMKKARMTPQLSKNPAETGFKTSRSPDVI